MKTGIVIGAGPAGLTAAYELDKIGMNSIILEADQVVGGISRTVNYKDYRFDIGGHRFFSKIPLVNQIWDEILDEDFLIRPRLSRIHYRGHFFDYPLKASNALAGLGVYESVMILLSYLRTKVVPRGQETNFEEWVSNRFGHRLYNIFFKTYTEKVWGIPCKEISADWAAQRIKNLSLSEALRNALLGNKGRTKDGQVITTLIDEFKYPRLGPGMMWEQCEALLAGRGHPTNRGLRVERVRHKHGRVECVYARNAEGQLEEFGGDHFYSTMPIRELIHSLDPKPPDEVLQAANGLRYRDYLTVVLVINREDIFPDNWIYIHTPDVKMGRIQNYKNWSPEMVPDQRRTSLGLEYFLWEQDDEWTWSDERLIELGIHEAAQIGLVEKGEVEDGTVVRMKKAYPVYDQSYQQNLAIIRRFLDGLPNLYPIGRNGQHRYNNQDHSMLTGVYAARNAAGANYDIWAVNTEQEYHEEDVAEDKTAGDRLVPMPVGSQDSDGTCAAEDILVAAFARIDALAMGTAVGIVTGVSLFIATASLLLQGGKFVGANLMLLSNYLPGFTPTWLGGVIGGLEAALGGFVFGFVGAGLRNWSMAAYTRLLRGQAEIEESKDILDKV